RRRRCGRRTFDGGRKMGKSLPLIALVLTAGALLVLLAASRPESVEQSPKQKSDGPAQPAPEAQSPAKIDAKQPSATLFKKVKVFDGKSDKLTASTSVLVVGNKIDKIGGDIAAPENATVIDGGGRTLMPGLIDAHWHTMLVRPTPAEALTWD